MEDLPRLGNESAASPLPARRAAKEASMYFDGKFCGAVGVY